MCLQSDHSGGAMMSKMRVSTALHAAIDSDTNQLLSHCGVITKRTSHSVRNIYWNCNKSIIKINEDSKQFNS